MKKVCLVLIVLSIAFAGNAQQKLKFGHLNSNDLLEAMPDKATAQKTLQDFSKQLEDNSLLCKKNLKKNTTNTSKKKIT
jgi:Skp family chaperone for outer membrane proteins